MQTTYLSCAETAQLVRAALKRAFPGVKFSVRSSTYSGGASIRVGWIDGPTGAMVGAVAKQFQGSGFDGMIDMKFNVSHWLLPDGSTVVATNNGTEGSRGSVPAERNWMPHPEAKLVSFCADHVFCNRNLSERFLRHACARLARKGHHAFATAEIVRFESGGAYVRDLHQIDTDQTFHSECERLIVA